MRLTTAAYGEASGVSIFIASRTTSGWRASTWSHSATSTLITVPGIGAVTELSTATPLRSCTASSTSGGAWGGGGRPLSHHAPTQGRLGARGGGSDSGGCSTRKAVVVCPART